MKSVGTARSSILRKVGLWTAIALLGAGTGVAALRARGRIRAAELTVGVWLGLGLPVAALHVLRLQREQRAALRNVLAAMEQSHSAVMIAGLDSRIEYANAGLCRQIGYSRRELIGRSWREFQPTEAPAERLAEMVRAVRNGNAWQGEWFNRRKNGELYPVRGDISPVRDRGGRLASFVAVFEDMTEAKRAEKTLRGALDRAEAADRGKSRFLATMSHELRTPLNGIVGFAGLLLDTPLTTDQRDYVHTIRTSSEALIQLTNDILDFARIESGGLKLELQPMSVRACVEDALDLLAVQAAGKKVELLHSVSEEIPAGVLLDAARLRQVLVNLLSNAVKFTDSGAVEVTVTGERAGPDDPVWNLVFSVRDTGIGIAADRRELLFLPFSQVDEASSKRYGGTGLGLAISQNMVQLMGGKITNESAPVRGSLFSFAIPAREVAGVARPASDLSRLHVALVAPAGPFRDELARLLRRWKACVTEVTAAALPSASWDVALVEFDLDTPRWPAAPEGLSLISPERLLAIVPVSYPSDLRLALRPSFSQVIHKPLHHDALLGMLTGIRTEPLPAEKPQNRAAFGLRVLVVEDNFVNQRLVTKLLANLGCTSAVAGNGLVAIEVMLKDPETFDLVLMDLHMPELDGLGAIEKMRAGEAGGRAKTLWVTVLTADARKDQKERVMAAGANDYMVKPVSLAELSEGLRRFAAGRAA